MLDNGGSQFYVSRSVLSYTRVQLENEPFPHFNLLGKQSVYILESIEHIRFI
jgi:hypothetical protein